MDETIGLLIVRNIGILLLFVGTMGNILSLIVLCRKKIRKSKIGIYLIILSISDLTVLFFGLLEVILRTFRFYVIHKSLLMCRVWLFFMMFPSDFSSWLTVIITLERAICVCFPIRSHYVFKSGCTIRWIIISIMILGSLNAVDIYFWQYRNRRCYPRHYLQTVFHGTLYSYLPATIIMACNIAIAYKLCRRPTLGRARPQNNGTIGLVLSINVVFVVTTIPFSVVLYFKNYDVEETGAGSSMLYANLVSCVNNAVNFILYVAMAKTFRRELKLLFEKRPYFCVSVSNETALTAF